MSFPRYSEYKDSGVEWLGKVPEHWDLRPLFTVMRERNESNAGMTEENLLSLSYGQIVQKDIRSQDGLLPDSFETYQIVYPGDIVFRLTDLQNDQRSLRTAIVQDKGIITSAYVTAIPMRVLPAYANYLLRAYDLTKVFYSMGGGLRQSMKFSDLKRMPLLLPVFDEQLSIADFLDRETAKIDSLVAEQERLIALLKEKRQAVVSHAVTKGLDTSAPMKDSGIEWIGEIPDHWGVSKLGYVASEQGGKTPSKENQKYWDGKIPWVSPKDMKTSVISDSIDHITPIAVDECGMTMIPENAVLVVVRGMILAHSFPVAETVKSVTINQDMKALISNKGVLSGYLRLVLESAKPYVVSVLVAEAAHGTRVLRTDIWKRLSVLIPPQIEQQRIIEHVSSVSEEYKRLVSQIERGIALLKERRSALISVAVTGKIDVRGLVAEEVTA
ncbi:MAG: restriction endonuclease subunit S [Bacilli bacterium]